MEYKPFLLDPSIPPEGYDFMDYMHKKGGGRIPPEQFVEGPRQMGLRAGLVFNFHDIAKAPNTMLAHCLTALTTQEKQSEMIETIYQAFFQFGQDIGDIETLLELASNLGMVAEALREGLADPAVREQVKDEVQAAYRMGITGVPFFILNGKYAFSGAQPPEVIVNVLQEVNEKDKDSH